jgi:hypothetical protein
MAWRSVVRWGDVVGGFKQGRHAKLEPLGHFLTVRYEIYRAGGNEPGSGTPVTLHLVIDAAKHLLKAELELSKKKAERVAARERYLQVIKEIAKITGAQARVGRVSRAALASALYEQLDAEIELEREKTH